MGGGYEMETTVVESDTDPMGFEASDFNATLSYGKPFVEGELEYDYSSGTGSGNANLKSRVGFSVAAGVGVDVELSAQLTLFGIEIF